MSLRDHPDERREAKQSILQIFRLLRRCAPRNDSDHCIAVRRYMAIHVDKEKCAGCGSCVSACPFGLIEIVDDKASIKEAGCTLCGACVGACSFDAIIIEAAASAAGISSDGYHGVWVYAEQRNGKLGSVGYELLARGRELADTLQTELSAVCLGHRVSDMDTLIAHGADKVYVVDADSLAVPTEDLYAAQMAQLVRTHKPEIVLAGATSLGRAFIPKVAAILKTGLTADCTSLDIDIERRLLLQTRPAFGGNIMATIICEQKRPQMATVRPRVFKRGTGDTSRKGRIINVDFDKSVVTSKTKLLDFIEDLGKKVKIEDADIIVSGGRGLGKPENFKLIEGLAQVLGAAVGFVTAARRRWLDSLFAPGRPDRQDRPSQAVHRLRYLRLGPAHGRDGYFRVHHCYQ